MLLELPVEVAAGYKSAAQRARVISEAWGEENLYCPACDSPRLNRSPSNTPAIDYACPGCDSLFQLKSQSRPLAGRLTDAAYGKMRQRIEQGQAPNLLALHYDPTVLAVRNLILIPGFAFSLAALERRKPLSPVAERAGWVGCNFLLLNLPPDAKIAVVKDGSPVSPEEVRREYSRLRPVKGIQLPRRGWVLHVLNVVRSIGKQEFSLDEVYAAQKQLEALYPANLHVRPKIRQQLQILRDLGYLQFLGRGHYRLV